MSSAKISCPFCGSRDVELVSAWGGQLITSQHRCRDCSTHFEAIRGDSDPDLEPDLEADARSAQA